MKQASFAMPVKRVLAIVLSLVLACTTVLVAPRGYAEETVDLHKYQQVEYAVDSPDKVFSLRKPSMFDSYKYYYTPVAEERDMYVSLGWEYVGEVESSMPQKDEFVPADGPVSSFCYYNLYNPSGNEFHVTTSEVERDHLIGVGWENRGFRYGARDDSQSVPVYRLYNPNEYRDNHYYTRDVAERDFLVEDGWNDEGVAWYSGPETERDLATVLESLKPADPSDNPSDLPTDGTIVVSGETGIRAEGNLSGANIPENATLEVKAEAVTSGAYFDGLDKSMGDARISDVYEITLMVNNQSVHDGFGELSISLPIDAKYNGHVIIVHHHQGADGITKTRAIARDGYVSFTVTSLSGFAMEDTGIETQTMYRLYNPNSGEHFYTASTVERDATIAAGWNDEGIGWIAPTTSTTPVYRLYSGTDHHYTMSAVERDDLVSKGWTLEGENAEGIAWYSDDAKTVPLYRQFNPNVDPSAPTGNSGSHNYTTSLDEHNSLVSIGWHDENVGWYAVAEK